jgi:hypothetical protein
MKARLKTIVLSAVSVFAVFSAITYNSCTPDKCKAIACAYGGICKDGTCLCLAGYEGTQCEITTRDKYIGTWTVFENGTYTSNSQYDIAIKDGLTLTDLNITNFYNHIKSPVAVKIQADSIFIPQQVVEGYEIQGWGYLDREAYYAKHGKITMHYTIKNLENNLTDDFGLHTGEVSQWTR